MLMMFLHVLPHVLCLHSQYLQHLPNYYLHNLQSRCLQNHNQNTLVSMMNTTLTTTKRISMIGLQTIARHNIIILYIVTIRTTSISNIGTNNSFYDTNRLAFLRKLAKRRRSEQQIRVSLHRGSGGYSHNLLYIYV